MTDTVRDHPDITAGDAPTPDDTGFTEWVERTTFSPEGVDRSLILENLRRTPAERLAHLERMVNELLELRGGRWPELP